MRATAVTPILNVSDFATSVAWFGKLGWSPGFAWREPGQETPTFGAVQAGGMEIFLCVNGQGGRGQDGGAGGNGGGTWLSIWVPTAEEVDAAHDTCLQQGLEVLRGPQDEPWDIRELQIRHPDGHVLRISAPARSPRH